MSLPHLIDAHCHLQDKMLPEDLQPVIDRAIAAGVQALVCCGTSTADWEDVSVLSRQLPQFIIPCFGLHPWHVNDAPAGWDIKLEHMLKTHRGGVGEIGLDFAVNGFNREKQEQAFIRQLILAEEHRRPVSIHCRKAWDAMVPILKAHWKGTGLLHSYSGGEALIPELAELGFSFSFSGTLTRSRNKKGHHSAAAVPQDRLLIETDSPDLPPVQAEGGINEPANLVHVVSALAEIRSWSVEETAHKTYHNARHLFTHT